MSDQIISISVPPFPDFIEGNVRVFKPGQYHPDRKNLGYFDLLFVKRGCLFLAEDEMKYTIQANQMFILLPDRHHYAWKPVEEETEFYWIHFYTTSPWKQDTRSSRLESRLPIPDRHFHQRSYTLHLRKQATIKEPDLLFTLIKEILDSTSNESLDSIWRTEELFLRFLKFIENQGIYKDRLTLIAEEVHLFLENNFNHTITNQTLENQFHLHSNYIAIAMKATFHKTALELLEEIRLDRAKNYLLNTDLGIKEIAQLVGFNSEVYFSNRFKKKEHYSPQKYRKHYKTN